MSACRDLVGNVGGNLWGRLRETEQNVKRQGESGGGLVRAWVMVWRKGKEGREEYVQKEKSPLANLTRTLASTWLLLRLSEARTIGRPAKPAKPCRQRDLRHAAQICSALHQTFPSGQALRTQCQLKSEMRCRNESKRERRPEFIWEGCWARCADTGSSAAVSISLYMKITTEAVDWTHQRRICR